MTNNCWFIADVYRGLLLFYKVFIVTPISTFNDSALMTSLSHIKTWQESIPKTSSCPPNLAPFMHISISLDLKFTPPVQYNASIGLFSMSAPIYSESSLNCSYLNLISSIVIFNNSTLIFLVLFGLLMGYMEL
jgi:hypothetical protein